MDEIFVLSSPDDARQHCDACRKRIVGLLRGGLPGFSNPEHANCVRMLLQYADLQITRVALWSDGPVDLLASVTRNLLEWCLWCKVVRESPKGIEELINDLGRM
jgi:hypothetical protein